MAASANMSVCDVNWGLGEECSIATFNLKLDLEN